MAEVAIERVNLENITALLPKIGQSRMSNTAYDTAWLVHLHEYDSELSNNAIRWLVEHQRSDGSWGASAPVYYHDRIICTLAAMIALAKWGHRSTDRKQIARGLEALEMITSSATRDLSSDPNGATVGFEMIVPTLVAEAEQLGIIKQQGHRILGRMGAMRLAKMKKLAGLRISRHLTAVLSSEMAGADSMHILDSEDLQEPNGSVGYSPSSTAYFALQVKPGDEKAVNYLRTIVNNGGAPFVSPFDIFERCWTLWNFSLLEEFDPKVLELIRPHLDYLESRWVPGKGVSFATNCALIDSDDTSVTHRVLTRFGRQPDLDSLLGYEGEDHFRCYEYETNPSIGANIHILGALKQVGFEKGHPAIQKILKFLRKTRNHGAYWFDKWHASPYYITSHAIIECQGYDDELCGEAVNWMLRAQNADGSWGFYGLHTAEETAFCLQALKIWRRNGGQVPGGIIDIANAWLIRNSEPPYPWLWIGKTLYYPKTLIQTIILTALAL